MKHFALAILAAAAATSLAGAAGSDAADAALEARQRTDCAISKYAGSQPDAPRPRGYMNSEAVDYDNPNPGYAPCSDAEYAEYKQLFDPARLLRDAPTAAGPYSAARERAAVLAELQRARRAGELNWWQAELGLPLQPAR